ncbi:hypothetical protein [Sphingomonas sp. Leaf10]|uniref:hypothetical protein n=1 Tax=Sphingomonas sp. Leaf10 TaxID=1735676 RepID=UPI0006FFE8D0|nr:hypothetical protein [Sphingomonas sp. Leaf10]KQM30455.1 hypothetical protein ASE59_07685 [Sphingomonas sp. Leaf10]
MHDKEEDDWPEWCFGSVDEAVAFDTRVARAIHTTEFLARMQADSALLSIPERYRGTRLSTTWFVVRRPSDQLLYVLRRRNRLQTGEGGWRLILDGPDFQHPDVMHSWSIAAVSALQNFLGDEATFIICHMLGCRPR